MRGWRTERRHHHPMATLWPCLQQLASCLCEIWMQLLTCLETAVQSFALGERKHLPENRLVAVGVWVCGDLGVRWQNTWPLQ